MLKVTNKVRALPLQIIDAFEFPGFLYLDPLEAPIFKLTISNYLKFGSIFVYYGDDEKEVVLNGKSFTLDLQKSHSYSEQTTLFPKGFLIEVNNEEEDNLGFVAMASYTYYWEL